MVGVRKINNSCLAIVSDLFLNNQPSTGMRERYGMPATVLIWLSTKIPPITIDTIATRAIANRGCADKVRVVAGDMLSVPLPAEADIHLFSNVLHDWDIPVVRPGRENGS